MAYVKLCVLSLLALGALAAAQEAEKQGKVWSLFSVVSFKNVPCRSDNGPAATSGVNRNGTCFTSEECTKKNGKASGNCAAGFGVCCLFVISDAATQITNNNTYIQNPGFPSVLSTTTSLAYTVKKCADSICMLRLDFESFNIQGVAAFDDTGVCTDSFAITTSVKTVAYPVICGVNNGQHLYIDVGTTNDATATLTFTFAGASTKRTWDIKVAQIACDSASKPFDNGCLQYLTGTTGRFSTFNFQETTTTLQHHLPNQRYSVCVRKEAGFCCVEYTKCADTNSFLITSIATGEINSQCTLDFIGISGVHATCDNSFNTPKDTRLCGKFFTAVTMAASDATVCDCSAPFVVEVNLNAAAADGGTANQRGVCLEYRQHPC